MQGAQLSGMVRMLLVAAGPVFFGVPAAAQTAFLSPGPAHSVAQPAPHSVIPLQPSFAPAGPNVLVFREHATTLWTPAGGTELPHAWCPSLTYRRLVVEMAGSVEEVHTPFLAQVRVPLISMGSGRVQLTGFQSVTPMANVVWGLPLRVSANGSSVVQLHPGIRAPRNNQSYGLSLRLRFSRQDANQAGNGLWRAARQAASWGRVFFTL